MNFDTSTARCVTAAAGVALALGLAGAAQAASPASDAQLHQAWRDGIALTHPAKAGCFTADFPSTSWNSVACVAAPNIPYVPRHGGLYAGAGANAGNGNDYAAVTTTLVSQGVGSFPTVTGVIKEKGSGAKNVYSIQLNSQFISGSPACSGASVPANCLAWQQFVYSSSEQVAFMQYWLINYNKTCPAGGWMKFSTDCYRNSSAVSAPQQAITQLAHLSVTGKAVSGGSDTITFTTATHAYSASGADTVVSLANFWKGGEFNIIGDGGGSQAKFNAGSSVTVHLAVTDGSTTAPTCQANDGTTGETNNLNLGACTTAGGSTPSITFTESN